MRWVSQWSEWGSGRIRLARAGACCQTCGASALTHQSADIAPVVYEVELPDRLRHVCFTHLLNPGYQRSEPML